MEIIRVIKNKDYTVISNNIFKNKNLSLKSKGLLTMLLSFSEDWDLHIEGLTKICKEGRRSIASSIHELIENGYMKRSVVREKGIIKSWEYIVYEQPEAQNVEVNNVEVNNALQYNTIRNKVLKNKDNKRSTKPSLVDIKNYCLDRKNNIDPEHFFDFYESKDWYIGKNKMKSWKACIRTWEKRNAKKQTDSKIDKQMDSYKGALDLLDKQYEGTN